MEGGPFYVVEWTIENLSHWHREVHGNSIRCSDVYDNEFELYPRGPSGTADHMVVCMPGIAEPDPPGEVALFRSDGTLVHRQQVDQAGGEFELVAILEEVTDNSDWIKLRFRLNRRDEEQRIRSVVEVIDASFRIDPRALGPGRWLGCVALGDGALSDGRVFLESTATSELRLVTDGAAGRAFSVRCRLMGDDDDDEKEHVFRGGEEDDEWTFSGPLVGGTLLLSLRIANGNVRTSSRRVSYCPERVALMPKKCDCRKKSSEEERSATEVLSDDMSCLYRDQDFSDFTLKCDNVSFPVHRAILSARSPVFKTMLSTDMTEASSGTVDIGDLDPSTLSLFLTYLYTGAVEDLHCDRALKLYYAADKYLVPSLKRECAKFLGGNVSVSNVCDVLSLADRHQDDELASVCHDFLASNFDEVVRSPEWKSFARKDRALAVKTITHF